MILLVQLITLSASLAIIVVPCAQPQAPQLAPHAIRQQLITAQQFYHPNNVFVTQAGTMMEPICFVLNAI